MKQLIIERLEELHQLALESGNEDYLALFSTLKWVIKDDMATHEFVKVLWTKFVSKYYVMNKMAAELDIINTNATLRAQLSEELDELMEGKL